jgi:DNA repair protein SbcC/Rad50
MKPIRLEMQAFGPFAHREVLDLDRVADRQLVLIHGPTGSGKTTLLDAICFALFGDTSGAERLGKQMRCSYAAPERLTYVRFDFRLGPRRFRVRREPEQERPKLRGEGVTVHKHAATLWETTEAAPEQEGRLVATGTAEVAAAVQTLVGFDANQFRQVVVLPQGRFRQFLVAGADEKEKILETLFRTQDYARVADVLHDRAREVEDRIRELQGRRTEQLAAADAESNEMLEAALLRAVEQLALARGVVPQRAKARDEALVKLEQGRAMQTKLDELAAARSALARLQEGEEHIKLQRGKLAAARVAEPLVPLLEAKKQREQEAVAEASRRDEAGKRVEAARRAQVEADERLERERERSGEREVAAQRVAYLASLQEPVATLRAAQDALAAAALEETSWQNQLEAARTERAETQRRRESIRQEHELATAHAAKSPALALKLAQLVTWLDLRGRVDRASIQLRDKTIEGGLLEREKKNSRAEQRRASKQDKALTEAWKRGRAGALARSLRHGEPCPVCGSKEHPSPASDLQDVPSDEEVEVAHTRADSTQRRAYEVREKFETCQIQAKGLEEQVRSLNRDLGEAVTKTAEQLAQLRDGVEQSHLLAEQAAASLPTWQAKLEDASTRADSAAAAVDHAAESFARAKAAAERARNEVERRQAAISPGLRTPEKLALAQEEARVHREMLDKRLEVATADRQSKATALSRAEADLAARGESAARVRLAARAADQLFAERLLSAKIASVDAFLAAANQVENIPALEREIAQQDRAIEAATDRLQRASLGAGELQPVDLVSLEAGRDHAQSAYDESLRLEQAAQLRVASLQGTVERLAALDAERGTLESRYEVLAPIARMARGTVEPRISFQRFVLASFLDEVLSSATARLSRMSKGRYALHRTEDAGHRGRAAGLDLVVTDTYTGTQRPVTTLSGGESFLAALALSLGLADVVQEHAGGIHLETLFVDEGFGTLDPESLEYALDTLAALGNKRRLVGIISHVPELQTRIPTRLEVVPNREGSTTRLTMG